MTKWSRGTWPRRVLWEGPRAAATGLDASVTREVKAPTCTLPMAALLAGAGAPASSLDYEALHGANTISAASKDGAVASDTRGWHKGWHTQ